MKHPFHLFKNSFYKHFLNVFSIKDCVSVTSTTSTFGLEGREVDRANLFVGLLSVSLLGRTVDAVFRLAPAS